METATKVIGVVIATVAIVSFLIPPLGTFVNVVTAWRFGAVGHVYYEVASPENSPDGNHLTPDDGRLWLLSASDGDFYEDVRIGDRVQAADEVRFHVEPTKTSRVIFNLSRGDCAIVVGKARAVPVENAASGGWLRVATTACGLFR